MKELKYIITSGICVEEELIDQHWKKSISLKFVDERRESEEKWQLNLPESSSKVTDHGLTDYGQHLRSVTTKETLNVQVISQVRHFH